MSDPETKQSLAKDLAQLERRMDRELTDGEIDFLAQAAQTETATTSPRKGEPA